MTQILGETRPQKYLKGRRRDLKRRVSNRESWNSDFEYSMGKKVEREQLRVYHAISRREFVPLQITRSTPVFKIPRGRSDGLRITSANISSRPLFVSFLAYSGGKYRLRIIALLVGMRVCMYDVTLSYDL